MKQHGESALPEQCAEVAVPAGCLDNGKIIEKGKFISFLKKTRKAHGLEAIALVLASSQVQTFSVSAKGAGAMYVKEAVEKMFGLPAKDIAFDYNTVAGNETSTVFHVTAMPKAVSLDFVNAFKSAGMTVTTIESVGHALSRDLLDPHGHENALIVNIDTTVTSLTFVVRGKISHTVLFEFGDDMLTAAVMEKLNVNDEEAQRLKKEDGLIAQHSRAVFDVLVDDCVALVQHINDTYISLRKQHPALPVIEVVYLTGTGSALRGLDEYISVGLRMPVKEGNVWANCLSFDEHIPALSQQVAVRYGAAIGVTLVGGDTINMLPHDRKKSLQRQHVARLSGKIFLSFVLGAVVGFAVAKIIAMPGVHLWIMAVLHKIQARW
jgi:Tfp pilus assembly PilM family ATPase